MKPRLLFDGDCNFCRRWINRWQSLTKDQVEYFPYQEISGQHPEIPLERFQKSVQFIETDGRVYEGAEAVFRTLAYNPGRRTMLWAYQMIPGVRFISEWFYALVARNRIFFSGITRFLWGGHLEVPTYFRATELFFRILGLIYLMAFVSFWSQLEGLIGQNGILPASALLKAVERQFGIIRFWLLPTLAWFNSSDLFLHFLCAAGVLFSLGLILGKRPWPVLLVLWTLYLSIVGIGQDFMEFQWDILLLETGFLSIFLTVSPSALWLFRWLLFRLMFSSGIVKLASGDFAWRSLTALNFHYETQPLPTWIGWYAHQLPAWFQKLSVLMMFGIEIGIPFLIFAPRHLRLFGGAVLVFFQLLILATGNYCFFNLLAIALCLLLFDDQTWNRGDGSGGDRFNKSKPAPARTVPNYALAPFAAVILVVTSMQLVQLFRLRVEWPSPMVAIQRMISPFHSVNSYGLFAVMTTSRPEIIVEGSMDGTRWLAYEFKWKPGGLKRRPDFVAPHQPRLDWQMWFAALGSYQGNPWFINFMVRLLEGRKEVSALLKKNPFPQTPPRYLRATVYDYRFTDWATLRSKGAWWRREWKGAYIPAVLSLGEV